MSYTTTERCGILTNGYGQLRISTEVHGPLRNSTESRFHGHSGPCAKRRCIMIDSTLADVPNVPNTPDTPALREINPSARYILNQLRAHGLACGDIATRAGVSRRTLEDIEQGRSTGARMLPQLRQLYDDMQREQAERRGITAVHEQAHMEALTARAPQIAELARSVADMELAAWECEQEERLYQAACTYLGPAYAQANALFRNNPLWRQQVIRLAYERRAQQEALLAVSRGRSLDTPVTPWLRARVERKQIAAATPTRPVAPSFPPHRTVYQIAPPVERPAYAPLQGPRYLGELAPSPRDAILPWHG